MKANWTGVLNDDNQNSQPGTAKNTFTTAIDIGPTPILNIPANTFHPGQQLSLLAYGVFSTTGTPTLQIGFYFGSPTTGQLAISAATTTGSAVANVPWRCELDVVFRGSTNPAVVPTMSQGSLELGTSVSAISHLPVPATALATVNFDLTAAANLGPVAAWGTSSVSNSITCHFFKARLED